jgi:hypothetical protein
MTAVGTATTTPIANDVSQADGRLGTKPIRMIV